VFFGALDPKKLTLTERLIRSTPQGRKLMPEGDFRDWDDVDAWSRTIIQEVKGTTASSTDG
jgi:menaquinone-dependent protoporphyrinogen oxidase